MFGCRTNQKSSQTSRSVPLLSLLLLAACASGPKDAPYPAFVQTDELPDIFVAGLPGIRAKQLAGNPETRRSSNRLLLPPQWSFSTGAAPGKSVEIYVLAGEINLGEFVLGSGGYAFVPAGSTGLNIQTDGGALLLYFLDDANSASVIKTPMILNRGILQWQALSDDANDFGVSIKELRFDPGSGARTVLLKMEPGATRPWMKSSVLEEGYLLEGNYEHSECIDGKVLTGRYVAGGYYHRPAGAVNASLAGGDGGAVVWLVRELGLGSNTVVGICAGVG